MRKASLGCGSCAIAAAGLLWSLPALADPCEGRLPSAGAAFSGTVRYVGDGDGLCIGPANQPENWIEVRLGDFYAPEIHERGGSEAKTRLARLVMGRQLVCRAGRRSYDRVIGYCSLGGRPLGALLRAAGGFQAGRGYRR
ncbi:MAG: nuclease [Sphingomonadales bacterium]|nr:MAG: nuclease [Sphingomonadales bacterium]